ncbi:MAG: YHS domain-containing protein [Cytophagales bacterium]|nr:YHS domain-containing protein [Cytophagales bacterium]
MKKKTAWILGALLFCAALVQAQSSKDFNLKRGVMAKGYDVVAYFEGKVAEGSKKFKSGYLGAVFYFSSEKNKNTFDKTPAKYMPEYGGWCAYAMGETGEKVDINPETFEIMDGKLYLFYNKFFNNTKVKWDKNPVELKKKADTNWKNYFK